MHCCLCFTLFLTDPDLASLSITVFITVILVSIKLIAGIAAIVITAVGTY